MACIDLELLKRHVRADEFADDDEYLQVLLDTAERYVIHATNRSYAELKGLECDGGIPLPLRHAILMLAGHWYNQREGVATASMQEVPYSMQALIKPYRKLKE